MNQLSAMPNPPREALARLRRNLRIPLHQVISYAELMVEDCEKDRAVGLYASLSGIIVACEASLGILSAATESEDVQALAETLRRSLLESCERLQSAATQLRGSLDFLAAAYCTADIDKLCGAISAFEKTVNDLSVHAGDASMVVQGDWSPAIASTSAEPGGTGVLVMPSDKPGAHRGLVLVVDDNEGNRDVLSRRLLRDGCEVMLAESGRQALRMAQRYDFDLILLDLMMPEMDGLEVLAELRRQPKLQQLPVVMISAADEIECVVRCIAKGADDYLVKPFNPVLLRARINALLERKRLQDEEKEKKILLEQALVEVEKQRTRARTLLLNVLPAQVAEELQEFGSVQPMYFEDVTIVFADIVNFNRSIEELPADDLVRILDKYFTSFDLIVAKYGLEKLKTIGDCYMYSGGLPVRNSSHPVDSVLAALELVDTAQSKSGEGSMPWQLRVGVHTGPVIAGVVGIQKFSFDIWGESVNFAARMESSGAPSRVNLSRSTYARVKDFFSCENRGRLQIKDGREAEMYFVNGIASGLLAQKDKSPLESFKGRYRTYFRKEIKAFPAFLAGPPL